MSGNKTNNPGITWTNRISVTDYNMLRTLVGWNAVAPRLARTGLGNSQCLIVAEEDGQPVAMGRLVGDGGYIVYIADIIVRPDRQRRGLGTLVMSRLMQVVKDGLKEGETVFLNLMAGAGKEPFYEKFGFTVRPHDELGAGMTRYFSTDCTILNGHGPNG